MDPERLAQLIAELFGRSESPDSGEIHRYRRRRTLLHAGSDPEHYAYCRVERSLVGHYAEREPSCPIFCECGNIYLATPDGEHEGTWRCRECGKRALELPRWNVFHLEGGQKPDGPLSYRKGGRSEAP